MNTGKPLAVPTVVSSLLNSQNIRNTHLIDLLYISIPIGQRLYACDEFCTHLRDIVSNICQLAGNSKRFICFVLHQRIWEVINSIWNVVFHHAFFTCIGIWGRVVIAKVINTILDIPAIVFTDIIPNATFQSSGALNAYV